MTFDFELTLLLFYGNEGGGGSTCLLTTPIKPSACTDTNENLFHVPKMTPTVLVDQLESSKLARHPVIFIVVSPPSQT